MERDILLMEKNRLINQLIWYYLQGFMYPKWCRIASIDCINTKRPSHSPKQKHILRETTGTLWLYLPNQDLRKIREHSAYTWFQKMVCCAFLGVWRKCLIPIAPKTHVVFSQRHLPATSCDTIHEGKKLNNSHTHRF